MAELMSVSRASAEDLIRAFRTHVGELELPTESVAPASEIGAVAASVWCWMRDAKEVDPSPESLDFATRQDGVSRLTQFVKRRDVPRDLIDQALVVLAKFGNPIGGGIRLEEWIDVLHQQCMSSFTVKFRS